MFTKERISFPRKWRTRGLSAWCVIERFKHTKHITNLDVKHWLESELGKVSTDTEMLTNFINDKIGIDLLQKEQTYIEQCFNNTVLTGRHFKISSDTLRYCIKCMQNGEHYVEQQLLPLTYCMYHPEQRLSSLQCPNDKCSYVINSTQFLDKSKGENNRVPFKCACGHSFLSENKLGLYDKWNRTGDKDFYNTPDSKGYVDYSILNEIELTNHQYIQLFTGNMSFNQSSIHNIKYRANSRNYREYALQCYSEILKDITKIALSYFRKNLFILEDMTINHLKVEIKNIFHKSLKNLDTSPFILMNQEVINKNKDKYWLLKHYMMNELSNFFRDRNNLEQSPFLIKYDKTLKILSTKYNLMN